LYGADAGAAVTQQQTLGLDAIHAAQSGYIKDMDAVADALYLR
jgi:hypothetical protein